MSDDRTFERNARAWLELGPTDAPDRVVEVALLEIESTPQERDLRIPWRLPTMTPLARTAILAGVVIVAAVGGIYLLRPATSSVGGPPSAAPSASPASTPLPSTASPLQVGTYVGPTLQVADIIASLNADADLTPAERTQLIDEGFVIKDKQTWSASIELRGEGYTQRQTVDGFTEIGSDGRYTFLDDHTVDLLATGDLSAIRFAITVNGDSFTLRSLAPPPGAVDAFVVRTLFEAGPFTLVR
jgi:hypothetical protein